MIASCSSLLGQFATTTPIGRTALVAAMTTSFSSYCFRKMSSGGECASACGLSSHANIERSRTKVQHTDSEWKAMLTPEQYDVARCQGTERPFHNKYWNDHSDGVYYSVCSDTPLFDSNDKFSSGLSVVILLSLVGTGWPSFTKPISSEFVEETVDKSHGMVRHEVHCSVDGTVTTTTVS